MSGFYQKFLGKQIDLAPLGICRGAATDDVVYFCTPVGYSLIGWTGVDGIHYCFIRGFGDMVFAVSPMNDPGTYVHPVAWSFEDFLRLLISCAGEAAVEQAWAWDRETFQDFMSDNLPDDEAEKTMLRLERELKLTAMEDPFAYIKEVQRGFDYSKIKFSPEYDQVVEGEESADLNLPWEVYFQGCEGRGKPGDEIPVSKWFRWRERVYYLPAVYTCGKGLVADLLVRVNEEELEDLERRWLAAETEEDREQLSSESPFSMNFWGTAAVNGKKCHASGCQGDHWYPARPEECSRLSREMVKHYELEEGYGWGLFRMRFPWVTKGKPKIRSLTVKLQAKPVPVPGPRFTSDGPNSELRFPHPITGKKHTLRVLTCEQQELSTGQEQSGWCCPSHCQIMEYTITPELPKGGWQIKDCAESDTPQLGAEPVLSDTEAAAIAIIGGEDGPTAVAAAVPVVSMGERDHHGAVSALHFAPVDRVEWKLVFYVKKADDLTLELI